MANADEDFAVPLGNVTFVGNDHEGRSALVPHDVKPDRRGPEVTWVHPADGSVGLALTTRVGLSMSDQVEVRSLTDRSLRLVADGGATVPSVRSVQGASVHLVPRESLAPNTTYTIVVDGVEDVVGNRGASFESTFTTGDVPSVGSGPPTVEVTSLGAALVGESVLFDVDVTGGAPPDELLLGLRRWHASDCTVSLPCGEPRLRPGPRLRRRRLPREG